METSKLIVSWKQGLETLSHTMQTWNSERPELKIILPDLEKNDLNFHFHLEIVMTVIHDSISPMYLLP